MSALTFQHGRSLLLVGNPADYASQAIFIPVAEGHKARLRRIEHVVRGSGTATFRVQRRTRDDAEWTDITGYSNISATTTRTLTEGGTVGLHDGDELRIYVEEGASISDSESEKAGLTVAFYLELELLWNSDIIDYLRLALGLATICLIFLASCSDTSDSLESFRDATSAEAEYIHSRISTLEENQNRMLEAGRDAGIWTFEVEGE
jgi:hypothetical protein